MYLLFAAARLFKRYTQQYQDGEALNLFDRMQKEGFSPDSVTFASILRACANICAIFKDKYIH